MKKDEKGEAVFPSVDDVLSDKIIDHSQTEHGEKDECAQTSPDLEGAESDEKKECGEPTKKKTNLILIILAGVIGVALILYGLRQFRSKERS